MAYAIYLHLWLLQKDIPPCTCHIETKRQFQGWWLPLDYNLRHIFDRYIWETKIYKRHIKIHPPFTTDVIDFSQIHYVGLPIFDCCSADRSDSWGMKFLSPVRYTLMVLRFFQTFQWSLAVKIPPKNLDRHISSTTLLCDTSLYSLVNACRMPPLNKKVFPDQVHQRSFESWPMTKLPQNCNELLIVPRK